MNFGESIPRWLVAAVILVVVSAPTASAQALGLFVPNQQHHERPTPERIEVLFVEGQQDEVDLYLRPSFGASVDEFGWVIPVSQSSKPLRAPVGLFDGLMESTHPTYEYDGDVEQRCPDRLKHIGSTDPLARLGDMEGFSRYINPTSCHWSEEIELDAAGQLSQEFEVFASDAATENAQSWFNERGLKLSDADANSLREHVDQTGDHLVGVRFDGSFDAEISPLGITGLDSMELPPVVETGAESLHLKLWFAANERVVPADGFEVRPNEAVVVNLLAEITGDEHLGAVEQALEEVEGPSVALESSLPMSELNADRWSYDEELERWDDLRKKMFDGDVDAISTVETLGEIFGDSPRLVRILASHLPTPTEEMDEHIEVSNFESLETPQHEFEKDPEVREKFEPRLRTALGDCYEQALQSNPATEGAVAMAAAMNVDSSIRLCEPKGGEEVHRVGVEYRGSVTEVDCDEIRESARSIETSVCKQSVETQLTQCVRQWFEGHSGTLPTGAIRFYARLRNAYHYDTKERRFVQLDHLDDEQLQDIAWDTIADEIDDQIAEGWRQVTTGLDSARWVTHLSAVVPTTDSTPPKEYVRADQQLEASPLRSGHWSIACEDELDDSDEITPEEWNELWDWEIETSTGSRHVGEGGDGFPFDQHDDQHDDGSHHPSAHAIRAYDGQGQLKAGDSVVYAGGVWLTEESSDDDSTAGELRARTQDLLVVDNGEATTFYQRAAVDTDANRAAMVIPVPDAAQFEPPPPDLFDALDASTEPRFQVTDRADGECEAEVVSDTTTNRVDFQGTIADESDDISSPTPPDESGDDLETIEPSAYLNLPTNPADDEPAARAVEWLRTQGYRLGDRDRRRLEEYAKGGFDLAVVRFESDEGSLDGVALSPGVTVYAEGPAIRPELGSSSPDEAVEMTVWYTGEDEMVPATGSWAQPGEAWVHWDEKGRNWPQLVDAALNAVDGIGFVPEFSAPIDEVPSLDLDRGANGELPDPLAKTGSESDHITRQAVFIPPEVADTDIPVVPRADDIEAKFPGGAAERVVHCDGERQIGYPTDDDSSLLVESTRDWTMELPEGATVHGHGPGWPEEASVADEEVVTRIIDFDETGTATNDEVLRDDTGPIGEHEFGPHGDDGLLSLSNISRTWIIVGLALMAAIVVALAALAVVGVVARRRR